MIFDKKTLTEKLEDELPKALLDDLDNKEKHLWYSSDELIEHIVHIVKDYLKAVKLVENEN